MSDDIIDRLRIAPHIPVTQLRAYILDVAPIAIREIELLRERESRRDTLPAPPPPPTKPAARSARSRLYVSGNRRKSQTHAGGAP
jgi:hypothetical protein